MSSRNPKNHSEKKHSFIEKWPEATRRKILIFLVSFITLIIFIGWISNFSSTIDLTGDEQSTQEFNEILEHTREAVEQIKQGVDEIKQGVDEIKQLGESLPTSSPELSDEEIKKLKEKIEEIQAEQ